MHPHAPDQHTLRAATADARLAESEFDNAIAWLDKARKGPLDPFSADVWVFDETLQQVLLVRHRWRGWGVPGGMVGRGETPRDAARRELLEETGIAADFPEDRKRIQRYARRLAQTRINKGSSTGMAR